MIRLHYSNRLESLIAPLAEAIADAQSRDPLEPVQIIVPNRVVEQFVRHRVAEAIGVSANLQFPFLRRHLARILIASDPNLRILDADDLQLVLFECLSRPAHRRDPDLAPVREYLEAGPAQRSDVELRTMTLAGRIAQLFREYSISRRPMVKAWRASNRTGQEPANATERWQRHLWRMVFDSRGQLASDWVADKTARWMMLPDAFEALTEDALRVAVKGPLHIFGQSYMGTAFAEMFSRLAEYADLRIYALNPCLEFWEDVPAGWRIVRDGWVHRGDKLKEFAAGGDDPFGLEASVDTPALRLWGRPGREHIRVLNQLTECTFEARFCDPADAAAPRLLHSLQRDILNRQPEQPAIGGARGAAHFDADTSIRFLACPGIRREVEIVANEIQSLMRDNDAAVAAGTAAPLRYHQISIIVPENSFEEYSTHIESVLRGRHGIPVEIVNRRFASTSRVAEAIVLLLALPLGRFTRDEMIRLLTHPSIVGLEEPADVGALRNVADQLGVFFGADDDDLRDTYIANDLFNWDQALRRLALGAFMAGERSGLAATFDTPDGRRYLPLELSQDAVAGLAKTIATARSLIADALEIRDARMTTRDWSLLLGELVNRYIRPLDRVDERIRDHFLAEIDGIAPAGLYSSEVSYAIAHELVSVRVAELESSGARIAETGVAAGSNAALRSIPFKVIFALGLGETIFPARSPSDPLDLRQLRRQAGDVTPTERDRYMFLEALLAARERIYFSYVAREARTGDRLEPSSAIRELQFILRGYLSDAQQSRLTVEHRVSRYDPAYFPTLPGTTDAERAANLASFDPDARAGARMIALKRSLSAHTHGKSAPPCDEIMSALPERLAERLRAGLGMIDLAPAAKLPISPGDDELWLPLSALRKFLECPLQAGARYALGMLDDDDEAGQEDEHEPLEQSKLYRSILLRSVFWESNRDRASIEEKYRAAYALAQMKGKAPAGPFAEHANRLDLPLVERWIAKASDADADELARWQDWRIGRADEFFHADRLLDAIPLDAKIRRADGSTIARRVMLYGTVRRISPGLDAAMQGVLRDTVRARDFLPLALHAIALSAAGQPVSREFRAIVVGGGDAPAWVRTLDPMNRDAARKYLARLAGDLLSNDNNYFLPLDAVEKVAAARRRKSGDPLEAVEKVRDGIDEEVHYCSSDSGPIRKEVAHGFKPPAIERLVRIVDERFAPIEKIFETRGRAR
ncbi:MAG TPA: exodeoxyribonuclease V subunit gamma [Candidatus Acidoferrales bacterium]|nr:exodeoxyribonuclease V subunit gamma [Candidatus Acidoferrales bacterium]